MTQKKNYPTIKNKHYYLLPLIVSGIVLISYESYHKITRSISIKKILAERLAEKLKALKKSPEAQNPKSN